MAKSGARQSRVMTERPETVTAGDEGSVRVVGTAHVSAASVEEVEATIEAERPDVVAVELDENRYRQLKGDLPEDLDAADLLEGNTVFQFLAYWMLSYVQTRLGERFDIEPGADMRAAVETAESLGLGVALVDRDIQTTIQRFWARMTLPERLKLVGGLAAGVADPRLAAITAGAGFGAFFGILATFVAALFGIDPLAGLALGDGVLRAGGGLILGAVAGLLLVLLVPALSRSLPLLAGTIALAGVGTAAVAVSGGSLGPFADPETFASTGAFALRGLLGASAGLAVGLAGGLLFGVALGSAPEGEFDEEFDIDELTERDVVSAMMAEFRRFSPGGAHALIDERDAYIAHKLHALRSEGYDVLAVVGAGHRQGIERYLENPETLPAMETLTGTAKSRRFSPYKAIGYAIALGFLAFFVLLALGGVQDGFLLRVFAAWFLFNGIFAFGMARLVGAHWQSAGVGGAVAWLTSINPLLAPGWFAGYVELRHTPVNVADIGTLNDLLADEASEMSEVLSEMLEVPLFRLIAIVAMTNVGSMIATFLFPVVVLPWLAADIGGVGAVGDLLVQGARNGAELLWGLLA